MSLTRVKPAGSPYETVAASQTAQVLGTVGAIGDVIERLIITPGGAAAGLVTLLDGATSIPIKIVETASPLVPYSIELRMKSVSGPWKVTTGALVTVIAVGQFS